MKVERVDLRPYQLPLRRPWRTAQGTLRDRRGWLVRLDAAGASGYGDCAPLPGAGTETPAVAGAALAACQGRLTGLDLAAAAGALDVCCGASPAARCGLHTALLDLQARLAGVPLRVMFGPARDRVSVNAALGALDDRAPARAAAAVQAGYTVLKLKVGVGPVATEVELVHALAAEQPQGIALRLDANRAWTPGAAQAFLAAVRELPIEALEEPLREPDPARLRALQATCGFALALDESAGAWLQPGGLASFPVARLVIKPAVLGGLDRGARLAARAAAAGIEVVLTSLLESAAGIWPALQLAAAVPGSLAHGLATSDWLAADLGAPPVASRGTVALPAASGSGCVPG